MCLDRVIARITEPTSDEIWVWKRFAKVRNGLCFAYQMGCAPVGKWLTATHLDLPVGYQHGCYQSGFHCYETKKDALDSTALYGVFVVRKVKVRKVRTKGLQFGYRVIVADEMFVPKVKRRKPNEHPIIAKNRKTHS